VKSVERTNVRDGRLLIPGQTCWRVERADQFACIIDAADYFHHSKAAISVVRWLVRVRPKLEVYLLRSNVRFLPAFEGIWGQSDPCSPVDWLSSKRLRFAIHGAHPTGFVPHRKARSSMMRWRCAPHPAPSPRRPSSRPLFTNKVIEVTAEHARDWSGRNIVTALFS
jgi:hypothetical protein